MNEINFPPACRRKIFKVDEPKKKVLKNYFTMLYNDNSGLSRVDLCGPEIMLTLHRTIIREGKEFTFDEVPVKGLLQFHHMSQGIY